MKNRAMSAMVAVVMGVASVAAQASTIAYWRFEEGPLGATVPASTNGGDSAYANTVLDSSGNANHLRTWATGTDPLYISSPTPVVPQTGAPNTLALEFVPNQDLWAADKPINTHVFNQWTVEASVRLDTHEAWQVFVGEDGKPVDSLGEPPFWLKHNDVTDLFELQAIDSTQTSRLLASLAIPDTGVWYHLAGVSDGTLMSFYIKGPGDTDYVLQGTSPFIGNLIDFNGAWTVGRGAWNGGIADWLTGAIDEVRISDTALAPSEFLMIPEPSSALLILAGLAGLFRRRRTTR